MTVAVVSPAPPEASARLLTVADLAALPSELPSGPVLYELDYGRLVILVADPDARTVTAHRRGQEPQVFTDADTLTVDDIIPGFRMAVRDVFQL